MTLPALPCILAGNSIENLGNYFEIAVTSNRGTFFA
jgi:hypothetical protein